jgi:hypothetical protein
MGKFASQERQWTYGGIGKASRIPWEVGMELRDRPFRQISPQMLLHIALKTTLPSLCHKRYLSASLERLSETRANPVLQGGIPGKVFGGDEGSIRSASGSDLRACSTHDQQTLPLQIKAIREYALRRGWKIVVEVGEIGSGAVQRPKRDGLLAAVRRRELDAIIVWRLDRRGRSLADLILTLKEIDRVGHRLRFADGSI